MITFKGKISVRPSDLKQGRLIQDGISGVMQDPRVRQHLGLKAQAPSKVFESHLIYTAAKAGDTDAQQKLEEMQRALVLTRPEGLGQVIEVPELTGFPKVVLGLSIRSEIVKAVLDMVLNGQYSVKAEYVVGMTPRDEAQLIRYLGTVIGWEADFIGIPEISIGDQSHEAMVHANETFVRLMEPIINPLREAGFSQFSYLTGVGRGSSPSQKTLGVYDFERKEIVHDDLVRYSKLEEYPDRPVSEMRPVVFGVKQ